MSKNRGAGLEAKVMEKIEVVNAFFTSVYSGMSCFLVLPNAWDQRENV